MTTARAERLAGLLVGGGLALVFVLWAAFGVAGWTIGTASRTQHRVIPGPVNALRIDGTSGNDVAIEAGSGPDATVDSVAHGSFRAPRVRVEANGASIRVSGGCRSFWLGRCHVDITVRVPPGTAVQVDASSGDVSASGLSGPVRLSTSSGDVSASDLSGPAALHSGSGDTDAHELAGTASLVSSSGDVEGNGLTSPAVEAHAGSGDVDLLFSTAPQSVDAETGSGDVSLLVPRTAAYAVHAETSSGHGVVGVRTDPHASRVLRARTGSGDINVLYGG
jgi:hypothetical protein